MPQKVYHAMFTICLVLFASVASAQSQPPSNLFGGLGLAGVVIGSSAFDLATTEVGLNGGRRHETNGLYGGNRTQLRVIKSGLTGLEVFAVWYAWKTGHKKAAIWTTVLVSAVNVTAGTLNVRTMRRGRR